MVSSLNKISSFWIIIPHGEEHLFLKTISLYIYIYYYIIIKFQMGYMPILKVILGPQNSGNKLFQQKTLDHDPFWDDHPPKSWNHQQRRFHWLDPPISGRGSRSPGPWKHLRWQGPTVLCCKSTCLITKEAKKHFARGYNPSRSPVDAHRQAVEKPSTIGLGTLGALKCFQACVHMFTYGKRKRCSHFRIGCGATLHLTATTKDVFISFRWDSVLSVVKQFSPWLAW